MSFIEKVSAAVVIDEKIIEKFEKAQERNKKESLEFFKATLIYSYRNYTKDGSAKQVMLAA